MVPFDQIPSCPVISRFVAPWDTSGWYGVRSGFAPGKPVYTNCPASVSQVPSRYMGAEYVVTFDSYCEGFDDKQEVLFYVERSSIVYVALDQRADASFLKGFSANGDAMGASNGCTYRIFQKAYSAGEQVLIPGFQGEAHHYFVLVQPMEELRKETSFPTVRATSFPPPYRPRQYRWYYHEVFSSAPEGAAPESFLCSENCRVERHPTQPQRKYVRMEGAASLFRHQIASGYEELEIALQLVTGTAEITFCGASVFLLYEVSDHSGVFHIRMLRRETHCELWINHCKQGLLPCDAGTDADLRIVMGAASLAFVDLISLKDQTEIYAVHDDFTKLPAYLCPDDSASCEIVAYPSERNTSLSLRNGAACFAIPAISGPLTVETKVRVTDDSFALLPELLNAEGEVLLRVAMYKNNLFASNGTEWVRLFECDTDWMYYPSGNWYRIQLRVDPAAQRYDLFVDGARRAAGFRLAGVSTPVAQIGFSSPCNQIYINDLRVYDAFTICRGLIPPGLVLNVAEEPYCAPSDGKTLATVELQRAIDDAACTGGTVFFPEGVFLTGGLRLHSDVTLFLSPKAVLKGSQDHGQYPLFTPGDSLCAARQLGRGILYGQNLCNVQITGGGVLDGQGLYRFKMNDPKNSRLPDCRPCMVYLSYCSGIEIRDIRFRSSAYWTVVPLSCRNLLLEHLDLDCMNTPNRDGIDPVDCCDMTIRHCNIMAGDDGLCFKSSDSFGCERIHVDDLVIQSLASGIKFGTDSYYSLKDTCIENCAIKNVNRCGVSLESVDGAEVENVLFQDIHMTDVGAPIYISIGVRNRCPRNGHPMRTSKINQVVFSQIRFDKPYPFSFSKDIREILVVGQSDSQPIRNVTFRDCKFQMPGGFDAIPAPPVPIDTKYPEYDQHGLSDGAVFSLRFSNSIRVENCQVHLDRPDRRPLVNHHDAVVAMEDIKENSEPL